MSDTSGVRFPPPLLYSVPLGLGFLVQRFAPAAILPGASHFARGAGALVFVAGLGVAMWGVLAFRRAGTSPNPTRPTASVVESGPYRFTRNPMYLGLAAAHAGFAIFFNALWPLLTVPVGILLIHALVIPREERYLQSKFGEGYARYRASVRRWI